MFLLASGFSITFHIHSIMSLIVLTCLTNWLVTSMEGLILITITGDGNPMAVIDQTLPLINYAYVLPLLLMLGTVVS